ncbi:hypothetical protein HZS_7161 [Henneguya salminicola]|nr:hypothetical protein HZS_7161 [Henneguya salminicola]
MIIDNISSNAATGARSCMYFIIFTFNRLFSCNLVKNSSNWFIQSKYVPISQIAFGLIINFFSKKTIDFVCESFSSVYKMMRFKNHINFNKEQNQFSTEISNRNFLSSSVSQFICLPFMASLIKICIQGYDLVVDVLEFRPNRFITSSTSSSTFYNFRGFIDCLISIYDDFGFFGYFYGGFSIFISFLMKYIALYLNNLLIIAYFRYKSIHYML